MKKAIVISLVALLLNSTSPFVFAQTLRAASDKDFNAAYDAQIRKTLATFPDLPAIAIVVIKDDRPIFVRAYGMADKEAGIKADSDTLFYTGSSTKSFTALAAAMLDQEGKIRLSDARRLISATFRRPLVCVNRFWIVTLSGISFLKRIPGVYFVSASESLIFPS